MRVLGRRVFLGTALAAACDGAPEPAETSSGRAPPPAAFASGSSSARGARTEATGSRLGERYPGLSQVPFRRLSPRSSPVLPALALGQRLGVGELWLKRDDAGDYGVTGSKVRKLEWLLAEAIARGKSSVLTFGGAGSNHALATAWYCRALGLRARLALSPQPRTQAVARTLLCAAAWGAELSFVPGVDDAYREALARQRASPESLLVAPGGTSLVGNLGFVEAGLELGHQLEEGALPKPEVIVLATGTMGSAAGLAVGLALAETQVQIVAVRCSSSASASGIRAMERELREWLRSRGVLVPATSAEVAVDDRQFGAGYARATEQGSAAARLALEHAGWLLEPTYTEKALAALPSHTLAKRRVLFWATQPGPIQTPEATEQVLRAVPLPLRALL